MMNGFKTKSFMLGVVFCMFSGVLAARDYTIGYGLVYSVNELNSSAIDPEFDDIAVGGHSSFFFVETPVVDTLSCMISPGAMNFEDNQSQLHVQYNFISLNYRLRTPVYPVFGAGIGGCIATLTKGSEKMGVVDDGLFIRNSIIMWSGRCGVGYLFKEKWEITIDGRGFGFFDRQFKNLNSLNIGASIALKI